MSRFPEVITLLSSDEESPSTEDVRPIPVKTEETIKLKESARKSSSIRKDIAAIKILGSIKTNSISNLNNINLAASSSVMTKNFSQTARKSIYSSQSSQNISKDSNSKVIQPKQIPNLNNKQLQDMKDKNSYGKVNKIHNVVDAKSQGRFIDNKSLTNNKVLTMSLNKSINEIPLADKLKQRGIIISTNKISTSKAIVKNDEMSKNKINLNSQVNLKLKNSKLLNGACENVSANKDTICHKNAQNHIRNDKDATLSWSKKRKLTSNSVSIRGQLKSEPSMLKKFDTSHEFKFGSQSKPELSMNGESIKTNQTKLENQPEHLVINPVSNNINAQNKVSSITNSKFSNSGINGDAAENVLSPSHIIMVTPDGIAYKSNSVIKNSANTLVASVIDDAFSSSTEKNAEKKVEKHASNGCQKDGSLNTMLSLRSEPLLAAEKVKQYLSSNSSIPPTTQKQTKEVTSPKLSLKRKREGSGEEMNATKKSLFIGEKKEESDEKQKNDALSKLMPSISIPKKDQKSCDDNKNASNSSFRGPLEDVINYLPGPSHETSSIESNTQKFEILMEFCMKTDAWNSEEKSKIKHVMFKNLHRASEKFVSSLDFSNLIDSTLARIKKCSRKTSFFLAELRELLKLNRCILQSKNPLQNEKSRNACSENDDSVAFKSLLEHNIIKKESVLKLPSQSLSTNCSKKTEQDSKLVSNKKTEKSLNFSENSKLSDIEAQKKLDEKILKLKTYLEQLHKKIKELQAKELSLDDLEEEDSTYILEDRYKKRFSETHKYLCQLDPSSRFKFELEKRYYFNGTRYQEINRSVEKFINKRKTVEKFPSYVDILNLVKATNESLILGIKESDYPNLARDIFTEVGNELKYRRRKDEEEHFGCYLTDNNLEEDPALKDEELNQKLTKSVKQGEEKLKELIEKYAAQQEATGSEQEAMAGEESDVSLEPKYNEVDDNLPSTNPATPEGDELQSPSNRTNVQNENVPVVIVGSDSDASTDPGICVATSDERTNLIATSITPVGSDSSCDLPSLDIL